MRWKNFLALPLAALLLLGTACSESTPSEYSVDSGYVKPTPTPEATGFRSLGETIPYDGNSAWGDTGVVSSKMEATVNKVQLFENSADAGIPEEELDEIESRNRDGELRKTPFVLVDVTIKKLEGLEGTENKEDMDNWEYMSFALFSKRQLGWPEEKLVTQNFTGASKAYFSDHYETSYDYFSFWLDVGEEKDYQIGFFLTDPQEGVGLKDWDPETECLSTDRDLLLAVGNGMNGNFHEFVDLEPELEG